MSFSADRLDKKESPIVVIGLGPIGIAAGIAASQAGYPVLALTDREGFSRKQTLRLDTKPTIQFLEKLVGKEQLMAKLHPGDADKTFWLIQINVLEKLLFDHLKKLAALSEEERSQRGFGPVIIKKVDKKGVKKINANVALSDGEQKKTLTYSEGGRDQTIEFRHIFATDGGGGLSFEKVNDNIPLEEQKALKDPTQLRIAHPFHSAITFNPFEFKKDKINPPTRAELKTLGWTKSALPSRRFFAMPDSIYIGVEIPEAIFKLKDANEKQKALARWAELMLRFYMNEEDARKAKILEATTFLVELAESNKSVVPLDAQGKSIFFPMGDQLRIPHYQTGSGTVVGNSHVEKVGEFITKTKQLDEKKDSKAYEEALAHYHEEIQHINTENRIKVDVLINTLNNLELICSFILKATDLLDKHNKKPSFFWDQILYNKLNTMNKTLKKLLSQFDERSAIPIKHSRADAELLGIVAEILQLTKENSSNSLLNKLKELIYLELVYDERIKDHSDHKISLEDHVEFCLYLFGNKSSDLLVRAKTLYYSELFPSKVLKVFSSHRLLDEQTTRYILKEFREDKNNSNLNSDRFRTHLNSIISDLKNIKKRQHEDKIPDNFKINYQEIFMLYKTPKKASHISHILSLFSENANLFLDQALLDQIMRATESQLNNFLQAINLLQKEVRIIPGLPEKFFQYLTREHVIKLLEQCADEKHLVIARALSQLAVKQTSDIKPPYIAEYFPDIIAAKEYSEKLVEALNKSNLVLPDDKDILDVIFRELRSKGPQQAIHLLTLLSEKNKDSYSLLRNIFYPFIDNTIRILKEAKIEIRLSDSAQNENVDKLLNDLVIHSHKDLRVLVSTIEKFSEAKALTQDMAQQLFQLVIYGKAIQNRHVYLLESLKEKNVLHTLSPENVYELVHSSYPVQLVEAILILKGENSTSENYSLLASKGYEAPQEAIRIRDKKAAAALTQSIVSGSPIHAAPSQGQDVEKRDNPNPKPGPKV